MCILPWGQGRGDKRLAQMIWAAMKEAFETDSRTINNSLKLLIVGRKKRKKNGATGDWSREECDRNTEVMTKFTLAICAGLLPRRFRKVANSGLK